MVSAGRREYCALRRRLARLVPAGSRASARLFAGPAPSPAALQTVAKVCSACWSPCSNRFTSVGIAMRAASPISWMRCMATTLSQSSLEFSEATTPSSVGGSLRLAAAMGALVWNNP